MGFAGTQSDFICALLTVTSTVPFALFTLVGIWFFSGTYKVFTVLLAVLSSLAFVSLIYSIWNGDRIGLWPVVGVALQIMSALIFGWATGTAGRKNLGLVFADRGSPKLITTGPYTFVRHPLYTSYILFWVGGFAVASSQLTLVFMVLSILVYCWAANAEDKILANQFKDEFSEWRKHTGAFFPKLR